MAKTVCEERERLWQRWIDACVLIEGKGAELESARAGEQVTRHLLNEHLTCTKARGWCIILRYAPAFRSYGTEGHPPNWPSIPTGG